MCRGQRSTGIGGYFGQSGSSSPRRHIENVDPRVVPMSFWCAHVSHRPKREVAGMLRQLARPVPSMTRRTGVRFSCNYTGSLVATFRRLLGFLRPYRRGVVLSALLAACAMVDDGRDPVRSPAGRSTRSTTATAAA